MHTEGMRSREGLFQIYIGDMGIFHMKTLNFRRAAEVLSFSEACFLFLYFFYYPQTIYVMGVTHMSVLENNFFCW